MTKTDSDNAKRRMPVNTPVEISVTVAYQDKVSPIPESPG